MNEDEEDEDFEGGDQVVVRTDAQLAEKLAGRTVDADDILPEQIGYCREVLQELLNKKHSVSFVLYIIKCIFKIRSMF